MSKIEGPKPPARILLVEDDPALQRTASDYLAQNNLKVVLASGREEMSRHLSASRIDPIILDLKLGDEGGLDLLRAIRMRSDLPVIIATGHRRDEIDRVVGLELGADDYITKPFGLRELLARIRVVLRRSEGRDRSREPDHSVLRFERWTLDRRRRQLTEQDGSVGMNRNDRIPL